MQRHPDLFRPVDAKYRLSHYQDLLDDKTVTVPPAPTIPAEMTADAELPQDSALGEIHSQADEAVVTGIDAGIKMLPKEKEDLDLSAASMISQQFAAGLEAVAGVLHLIPNFSIDGKPLGVVKANEPASAVVSTIAWPPSVHLLSGPWSHFAGGLCLSS